jgi:hypothetical protein
MNIHMIKTFDYRVKGRLGNASFSGTLISSSPSCVVQKLCKQYLARRFSGCGALIVFLN